MLGLKLASLYSLPPCRLGFCGFKIKNSAKILTDFLQGKKTSLLKIRKTLEGFEASYPYYQLIAKSNGINNPFDYKVVEAYWLGNDLLARVKVENIKKLILTKFCQPGLLTQKQAEKKAELIPKNAKPHHSFHVNFLGSITGSVKFNNRLRQLCQISPKKIKNGNWVTLHWNQPCQIINKKKAETLLRYTQLNIRAFNELHK